MLKYCDSYWINSDTEDLMMEPSPSFPENCNAEWPDEEQVPQAHAVNSYQQPSQENLSSNSLESDIANSQPDSNFTSSLFGIENIALENPGYGDCSSYFLPSLSGYMSYNSPIMDEARADNLEKRDKVRNVMISQFNESHKRPVALYEFYQQKLDGRSTQEAAFAAGLIVGVNARTVVKWNDEFLKLGTCSIPSGLPGSSIPRGRRTWLLEDYPELLQKAQEWVDENMESSLEKDGRLFRIIDFQKWVNTDLLLPVFERDENVTPISHSTARSWLNRLGYYEELRKQEEKLTKLKADFDAAVSKKPNRSRTNTINHVMSTSETLIDSIDSSSVDLPAYFESPVTRRRSKTWSQQHQNMQID